MLVDQIPQLKTNYINSIDDRRDYRVSFEKLESRIGFNPSRTVGDGVGELLSSFQSGIITENDFASNNLEALTEFFGDKEKHLAI